MHAVGCLVAENLLSFRTEWILAVEDIGGGHHIKINNPKFCEQLVLHNHSRLDNNTMILLPRMQNNNTMILLPRMQCKYIGKTFECGTAGYWQAITAPVQQYTVETMYVDQNL